MADVTDLGHEAGEDSRSPVGLPGYGNAECRLPTSASSCPIATASSATSPTAAWPPSGRPRTPSSGRLVAVKVLAPHVAADPSARTRFEREARTAARVSDHPNVATIYDVGEHDDSPFIVMELFTRRQRRRPAAGRPAVHPAHAGARVARAGRRRARLRAREGIVHRDVKPANLLLDERERLAVGDFGIARAAEDSSLTQAGQVLGTAAYLSPEQALGKPATAASDRYSLAVVAFELLTGRRPYQGEHIAAQARQHVEGDLPASELGERGRRGARARDGQGARRALPDRGALRRGAARGRRPRRRATAAAPPTEPTRPVSAPAPPRRPPPRRAAPPPARARRADTPSRPVAVAGASAARAAAGARRSPPCSRLVARRGGRRPLLAGGGDCGDEQRRRRRRRRSSRRRAEQPAQEDRAARARRSAAARRGDDARQRARGRRRPGQRGRREPRRARTTRATRAAERPRRGGRPAARAARSRASRPQGDAADPTTYGYALYNLGTALVETGRPDEAIPYFERRLEVSPDDRPEVVRKAIKDAEKQAGKQGDGQHQRRLATLRQSSQGHVVSARRAE